MNFHVFLRKRLLFLKLYFFGYKDYVHVILGLKLKIPYQNKSKLTFLGISKFSGEIGCLDGDKKSVLSKVFCFSNLDLKIANQN